MGDSHIFGFQGNNKTVILRLTAIFQNLDFRFGLLASQIKFQKNLCTDNGL